jgi:hypothetical protein
VGWVEGAGLQEMKHRRREQLVPGDETERIKIQPDSDVMVTG